MNLIETAIATAGGITAFTKALNARIEKPVTYQAVRKWAAKGHLPRTEWTGETHYAAAIESITDQKVAKIDLLASLPGTSL
ncbi:hypothetical protein QZM35_22835 [Burkholderia sp. AU45274]|uniref:hypothetical protein n=1 Tax=Burkholderia sp. AU45274 TaxID=3059205 RepID=UPI0026530A29|nr:hypothetical protein [Burkholderia sp. AU45274]MDN7490551.1 hypothetical protein [Burkholderia sp. AU45274]